MNLKKSDVVYLINQHKWISSRLLLRNGAVQPISKGGKKLAEKTYFGSHFLKHQEDKNLPFTQILNTTWVWTQSSITWAYTQRLFTQTQSSNGAPEDNACYLISFSCLSGVECKITFEKNSTPYLRSFVSKCENETKKRIYGMFFYSQYKYSSYCFIVNFQHRKLYFFSSILYWKWSFLLTPYLRIWAKHISHKLIQVEGHFLYSIHEFSIILYQWNSCLNVTSTSTCMFVTTSASRTKWIQGKMPNPQQGRMIDLLTVARHAG